MPGLVTSPMRPRRLRSTPTEDGEFVVFEAVPLFDEHTGEDGVVYTKELLQRIAENCNNRIRDTGDYTPVVVGHTRDKEHKRGVNDDPPVIGFCGPFWVGEIGNLRPRACIMASFWIYPEHEETFTKRNPRRSVEVWPESKPEDRYFDPVSVLGAETPRRDLGMTYAKGTPNIRYQFPGPLRYSKRSVQRYAASTPLGGNVTLPTAKTKQKNSCCACEKTGQPTRYQGDSPMLSQDDIQQIVEAMRPIIQSELDQRLQESDDSEATKIGDTVGDEPEAPATPDASDAEPADAGPPPDLMEEPGDDDEPEKNAAKGFAGPKNPMPKPAPTVPGKPPANKPQSKLGDVGHAVGSHVGGALGRKLGNYVGSKLGYGKHLASKLMKYAEGDEDGRGAYVSTLDQDDVEQLRKYMESEHCDEDERQRYSAISKYYANIFGNMRAKGDYDEQKDPHNEDVTYTDVSKKRRNAKEEEERYDLEDPAMKHAKHGRYDLEGKVIRHAEREPLPGDDADAAITPEKYAKSRGELAATKQQYAKLAGEHSALVDRYAKLEKSHSAMEQKARIAGRRERLIELKSEGYVLDPDSELMDTADFTDDQFRRHTTKTIPQQYQKLSGTIPIDIIANGDTNANPFANPRTETRSIKYNKQAQTLTERLREKRPNLKYQEVLTSLIEADGDEQAAESRILSHASNGNGKAHA